MEENRIPEIDGTNSLASLIQGKDAVLVYFSTEECQVCKVLKPRVADLVESDFPLLGTAYADINRFPGFAAQHRVFTAPTIIVFFEGKEYIRKSRSFSLDELKSDIERIYNRMFGD